MKIISICLITLLFMSCSKDKTDKSIRELFFGQANPNYLMGSDYNYFTLEKRTSVLNENFNNNVNNWPVDYFSNYNYRKIQDGLYTLSKGLSSNTQQTNLTSKIFNFDLDTSKNFEIEMRFNAEIDDDVVNPRTYSFSFSTSAESNIIQIYGQQDKIKMNGFEIKQSHTNSNENNNFDIFTLRKLDQFYYVFLNKKLIHSTDTWFVKFNKFKFQTTKFVEFDFIKIDYLII